MGVVHCITFNVDVSGEIYPASSVLDAIYARGAYISGAPTMVTFDSGIAPLANLGDRGMLMMSIGLASQHPQAAESASGRRGRSDCQRRPYKLLEAAFGYHDYRHKELYADEQQVLLKKAFEKLKGTRPVPQDAWPAFIWFPKDGTLERGQFVCADMLSKVFGTSVDIVDMKIEILPGAPLLTKHVAEAPWLDQLRNANTRHEIARRQNTGFVPRLSQIERVKYD